MKYTMFKTLSAPVQRGVRLVITRAPRCARSIENQKDLIQLKHISYLTGRQFS